MTMYLCDIIIPTHAHPSALPLALEALATQHIPDPWRIRLIVSYDGLTPPPTALPTFPPPYLPLQTVTGPHAGAATARNRALAIPPPSPPTRHIILFLGDDIILRPNALAAHLDFHRLHPKIQFGALGFLAWDPRLLPTPLMEWMVHGGPQNNFDDLLSGEAVDPAHFFYGSFVSVKKALLQDMQFPTYTHYGWEDLDLGRQLAAKDLRLFPLSAAQALHHHHYSPTDIIRRARLTGRSLVQYQARYPDQPLMTPTLHTWWRLAIYRYTGAGTLLRLTFRLLASRICLPRLFLLVTAAEQWLAFSQDNRGKLQTKK